MFQSVTKAKAGPFSSINTSRRKISFCFRPLCWMKDKAFALTGEGRWSPYWAKRIQMWQMNQDYFNMQKALKEQKREPFYLLHFPLCN